MWSEETHVGILRNYKWLKYERIVRRDMTLERRAEDRL